MYTATYPYAYCLFCQEGAEALVGARVEERISGVRTLLPMQEKHRLARGRREATRLAMLPGCLFLYARERIDLARVFNATGDARLSDGIELRGGDKAFADWLMENGGVIGMSRLYMPEGRLRVLSGPMLRFIDRIVRVDRRVENALVELEFLGRRSRIWLPFELAEALEA